MNDIPFLGIFVSKFRYFVFAVQDQPLMNKKGLIPRTDLRMTRIESLTVGPVDPLRQEGEVEGAVGGRGEQGGGRGWGVPLPPVSIALSCERRRKGRVKSLPKNIEKTDTKVISYVSIPRKVNGKSTDLWRTASLRSAPQATHVRTSLCCCR
jgi:hypothetical protein